MALPATSPSTRPPDGRPRRRSRTVRSKKPPPMQMTERRGRVVAAAHRLRVFSRDQAQRYCGYPSRNTADRDLGLLFHHGYLARHFTPPLPGQPKDDHQALYSLDRKGAEFLAAQQGLADWRELGWQPRDNDLSWWHLNHLVVTNDLLINCALAAEAAGSELGWLAEWELRRPERKAQVDVPLPGGRRQRMTVIADAYVVLHPPGGSGWPSS